MCCHWSSSRTNMESFEHCSLTSKSPKVYPSERVFPSLLNATGFSTGLLLAKFLWYWYVTPNFPCLRRDPKGSVLCGIRTGTWIWHIVSNWCGHHQATVNYLSSECCVICWVPSKPDFMSLTFYFPRIWRQLFAVHRIDIDQRSLWITQINLNPGIDKKLHPS